VHTYYIILLLAPDTHDYLAFTSNLSVAYCERVCITQNLSSSFYGVVVCTLS